MATTTLRPNGTQAYGTYVWTNDFDAIDEPVATHDGDSTFVESTNASSSLAGWQLTDVPADFNPAAINSITIRVAHRRLNTPNMAVDLGTVTARLVRLDGTTAISTTPTAVNTPIQAGYAQTDFTPSYTGTHTVADWNDAHVELTFTHTAQQAADSVNQMRVTAVEVEVDYTPAAPVVGPVLSGRAITPGRIFGGSIFHRLAEALTVGRVRFA